MVQGNSSSKINLRYVEIRSDELVLGSEVKRGQGPGNQPSGRDPAQESGTKPVLKWSRGLRQPWMQEKVGGQRRKAHH